ncbi:MAG: glycerol-3-phosphate acyltransferase [Bacteroidetes bacterium]|nr:glycerol-3-phosphate acyltransferase [Bacteroidota bacterium]MCW5897230.1 glycerol-3-phosphate acyltransferase [Bacteroidota bacterium]
MIFLQRLNKQRRRFVLPLFVAVVIGYLMGSFPAAYVLVKWKSNLDIRHHGSGNVGTLNSYEVTNSKIVGVGVLLLDLVKGVLSVFIVSEVVNAEFPTLAVGGVAAVVGHNFPVWLGFKGGRGLATAAGVMFMVSWICVLVWMGAWLVGKKVSRDVNVGNAAATILMVVTAFFLPAETLARGIPMNATSAEFKWFVAALAFVILLRLIQPVKQYIAGVKS